MSFYKKMKEDAKRQKKEIMSEAPGYYYFTSFNHYGEPQKRQFSWGRVLTYASCLVLVIAAGLIWSFFGGATQIPKDFSSAVAGEFLDGAEKGYTARSLIYNGEYANAALNAEAEGDYKVESDGIEENPQGMIYLKKQKGVVLSNLSAFSGQSVTISYKVFVNELQKDMYYLFALSSQQSKLEIITFTGENYSASKYKSEAQKITLAGKTIYLKTAAVGGETHYQVFYKSGGKGVYLTLAAPQEGAYALLESVLSSLTD